MKKLIFILDHLKGGGAERIALELCEQLTQRGFELVIVLLDGSDIKMPIPSHIKSYHLNVNDEFFKGRLWKNTKKIFNHKDIDGILRILDNEKPDKVIVSPWRAFYFSEILPKVCHADVWCWVHGEVIDLHRKPSEKISRWYKETRRLFLEKRHFSRIMNGNNIIVANENLKKEYQSHIPNAKIHVLYNGIDFDRVKNGVDEQSEKQWDCIFVGRLSPEKQPDHAIRAFANSGLNGRMAIVGDGQMKDELMVLCKTLNIVDKVDFLGWQTNPYQYIVQAKCLVLSSSTEGSPLIVVESLILGVPVVAYDLNDGIHYQLNHKNLNNGLVESQNIQELSKKIKEISESPYIINSNDIAHLSIQNMTSDFLNIID